MLIKPQIPQLAALIIADEDPGTPLVLGRSLTELQIARVVSAGARHIVCMVAQVSPQMLAVSDNLRANGLTIDIVRNIADAADAIHPDETLFLVASQVLVSEKPLTGLLEQGASALLCVGWSASTAQFEIIDATTRWTGYALLNGSSLRQVANMVGDWDAASTLLRHLVQEHARRVILDQGEIDQTLLTIRDEAEALKAGRKLLGTDAEEPDGIGNYWVGRPVGRFVARLAGEVGLKSKKIAMTAAGIAGLSVIVSLAGWLGSGLFLLLFSFFAHVGSIRLASALGDIDAQPLLRIAIKASAVVVVTGFAVTLWSRTGQWGYLILGGLLIGCQVLIQQNLVPEIRTKRWLCDPLSGVMILLLGAVLAVPVIGLLVATAHAVGSHLWLRKVSVA